MIIEHNETCGIVYMFSMWLYLQFDLNESDHMVVA